MTADDQAARADLAEAEDLVRRYLAAHGDDAMEVVMAEYDRLRAEIDRLTDPIETGAEAAQGEIEELREQLVAARVSWKHWLDVADAAAAREKHALRVRDCALELNSAASRQVEAVRALADDLEREAAGTDQWRRMDRDDEALAMVGPMKARQLRDDANRIRAVLDGSAGTPETPAPDVEVMVKAALDGSSETPAETGDTATADVPENGHTFAITVACRGSSSVTGQPGHSDANWWGGELRLSVRSWSLRAACEAAAGVPLNEWAWDGREDDPTEDDYVPPPKGWWLDDVDDDEEVPNDRLRVAAERRREMRINLDGPHLVDAAAPAMRILLSRVEDKQLTAEDARDILLDWPNRARGSDTTTPGPAATFRLIGEHLPVYGTGSFVAETVAACRCGVERAKDDPYGGWWAWHVTHALAALAGTAPTPPTLADDEVRAIAHMVRDTTAPGAQRAGVDDGLRPCGCCEIEWRLCRGLYDKGCARCCSDCTHNLTPAPGDPTLIGTWADPEFVAHQDHRHPVDGCGYCPDEETS